MSSIVLDIFMVNLEISCSEINSLGDLFDLDDMQKPKRLLKVGSIDRR